MNLCREVIRRSDCWPSCSRENQRSTKPGFVEGVSTEGHRIQERLTHDDVAVSGSFNERIPLPLEVISAKIEGFDRGRALDDLQEVRQGIRVGSTHC